MNLARLVTEGLGVLESSISNFINVGQWQKYGLKFFFLNPDYLDKLIGSDIHLRLFS